MLYVGRGWAQQCPTPLCNLADDGERTGDERALENPEFTRSFSSLNRHRREGRKARPAVASDRGGRSRGEIGLAQRKGLAAAEGGGGRGGAGRGRGCQRFGGVELRGEWLSGRSELAGVRDDVGRAGGGAAGGGGGVGRKEGEMGERCCFGCAGYSGLSF
jgi:hypothetical protein